MSTKFPWHVSVDAYKAVQVGVQDLAFRTTARKLAVALDRSVSSKETRLYIAWRAKNVKRAQKFWTTFVKPTKPVEV